MSRVSPEILDALADAYDEFKVKKARVSREVHRRFQEQIDKAIEEETRVLERAFAVQLVEARELGATRKELVKVIGDGTAATMRRFIELGGGTVQTRKTGADRAVERREALGVVQVGENLFEWTVAPGVTVEATINWFDGKPVLFPVGEGLQVSQEHGIKQADYYAKGQEVVKEFGIKEEEVGGE